MMTEKRQQSISVKSLITVFFFIMGMALSPSFSVADEIKVKMSCYHPPGYVDLMTAMQGFVDEVNAKGKGKVKIDFYHSGKLLEVKETLPGLMQGVTDIGVLPTTYIQGTYPLTGVLSLPLLFESVDHFINAMRVNSPLYNLLNEELAKKNLYALFGPGDMREILWTKKPVRKPDDLKGLKIRAPGVLQAKEVEAYGGAPVTIASSELYLALQTGVCDGALNSASTTVARGLGELVKYGIFPTRPFEFYGGLDLLMRADWLKKLPKDVYDIIMEAGKNYQNTLARETVRVVKEEYEPKLKKAGVEFLYLTQAETDLFIAKNATVWDFYKSRVGKDGAKAIEFAKQAAAKK